MDRRSWLWRRKSSEKSPSGETESTGSLSSHSERFSDDQALSNHNFQSPGVTPKALPSVKDHDDNLKIVTEKLSQALLDVRTKEDLVKQHSKIAEEAVTGWERANNEVSILKRQIEVLTQKNSFLEERADQLDGALKECLRQLRLGREDQEEKIYDAVATRTFECELEKSKLENQLTELCSQVHNAKTDIKYKLADASSKLEAAEKENSILKLKLTSKFEELEMRTSERDLSTYAAESASKQYLDSIKKIRKLEAECRRLTVVVRKSSPSIDNQSISASSVYGESLTGSQPDGDRLQVIENDCYKRNELESIDLEPFGANSYSSAFDSDIELFKSERNLRRNPIIPSVEINLMDDFLEMERIVALPEIRSSSSIMVNYQEESLKDELEAMLYRTAELEKNLGMIESEKINLEMALKICQVELKASEARLQETEAKLAELSTQLTLGFEEKIAAEEESALTKESLGNLSRHLDDAKASLHQTQRQLFDLLEENSIFAIELDKTDIKKTEAESQMKVMELEIEELHLSVRTLENEISNERTLSREAAAKCEKLEAELSDIKLDYKFQTSAIAEEFRINQDTVAKNKFAECQKTIASLDRQLKSLAKLDDFLLDSEKPLEVP